MGRVPYHRPKNYLLKKIQSANVSHTDRASCRLCLAAGFSACRCSFAARFCAWRSSLRISLSSGLSSSCLSLMYISRRLSSSSVHGILNYLLLRCPRFFSARFLLGLLTHPGARYVAFRTPPFLAAAYPAEEAIATILTLLRTNHLIHRSAWRDRPRRSHKVPAGVPTGRQRDAFRPDCSSVHRSNTRLQCSSW